MGKKSNPNIWVNKQMLKSDAFRTLPAAAKDLYLHFLMKRQMEATGQKGKKRWNIKNNGDIIFTYAMGKQELGMEPSTFMRSLDRCIDQGLLDIVYSGSGGKKGDCSKYAISNRWVAFGTSNFIEKSRPKDLRQIGFKYNKQHIKRQVQT